MDDARIAVETGVDGVDVVIGTSSYLREHSHGKDMTYIKQTAIEVIEFVKSKGIEIRFSSEDSFRSDLVDLLSIYSAVDKVGVDRGTWNRNGVEQRLTNEVGIADTVGCASVCGRKETALQTAMQGAFKRRFCRRVFGHLFESSIYPHACKNVSRIRVTANSIRSLDKSTTSSGRCVGMFSTQDCGQTELSQNSVVRCDIECHFHDGTMVSRHCLVSEC